MKPEVLKSWSLEIDYSRAPCLGADQKARGLWERDWLPTSFLSRIPSRFLNNQWRFCYVWQPRQPVWFERERERLLYLSASSNFKWINQSWRWNDLASGRCRRSHYKSLRKAEEANFKANFSFFTSLSTGEAHIFGVKFIGLYGTVGFIAIRGFSFWGESDLWSDVWPAMDGVVSLLTEVSHESRRGKNERFAVARRETRKRIKETKYDFSL